jgi:hypothetical protein
MNFEILIPTPFYFLLTIYSFSNFYFRKYDLDFYRLQEINISTKIPSLTADRQIVGFIANIFSILHVIFYIYFAYKFNLFSAIVLTIFAEIFSTVLVFIESKLTSKFDDRKTIKLLGVIAEKVNVLIIIFVFLTLKNLS